MIVGIGMDLVEIGRIEESLRRFGSRFQERVFTDEERAYCNALPHPAMHYAARLAAKEAFLKALGTGLSQGLSWRDVGIERKPGGQPMLRANGLALVRARELGVQHTHVSLSHTAGHAAAVVVLERA